MTRPPETFGTQYANFTRSAASLMPTSTVRWSPLVIPSVVPLERPMLLIPLVTLVMLPAVCAISTVGSATLVFIIGTAILRNGNRIYHGRTTRRSEV